MTSAGRSTCTPSTYLYASNGEYAGGGRAEASIVLFDGSGDKFVPAAPACDAMEVSVVRWISDSFGEGGSGFIGDSGGGSNRTAIPAAELLRLCPVPSCARVTGETDRDPECDDDREVLSELEKSTSGGGEGGRFVGAAEWNGASVGEIYRPDEGPASL